jgi:quercetin dioxygenase-like cupin family protein
MLSRLRYPILLAASVLAAGAQTLIDNDQVRVLKVTDKPHVKNNPHEHKINRVMIYLQAGKQEFVSGGKTEPLSYKAGDVKWSPATTAPHTSEVVSAEPVTMIEIELKKPADPAKVATAALDPLKVAPKIYHLEFENPQVRVFRVHMAPHQKVPLHEHMVNRVVVYLTDQEGTTTIPGGQPQTGTHKAGEASFGGPVKHSEENLMAKAFEALVVELKN